LENVLTQAVIRLRGNILAADSLSISEQSGASHHTKPIDKESKSIAETEADHICHGHKGKSCKVLGISRPALDRKILRYVLSVHK
jgi:two-component system response regulator AtoC